MINIAFDEEMMREAIAEGKKAAALGEAPIGAVIVQNGVVLSRGHNLRETGRNALAHAEIVAIDAAFGSLVDLSKVAYNHSPQLTGGILAEECAALLREFFRTLRRRPS